jgi:hypothetical protein
MSVVSGDIAMFFLLFLFACSEAISLLKSLSQLRMMFFAKYNYAVFCDPVLSVKCIFLAQTDSVPDTVSCC